jgi:nitrate/nitrite transporter NarK
LLTHALTIRRYDFAVYGLLAPEIGRAFFPHTSEKLQLINSFGVYLAAFLMRPLGAIMFGEIGDRMIGRKNALVFSIVLITVPSILMGLLPSYETWGWASPALLVVLRMLQGLSVGGQLAGSYVLSIEQSSSRTRGFRGSVCDASSVSPSRLDRFLLQLFDAQNLTHTSLFCTGRWLLACFCCNYRHPVFLVIRSDDMGLAVPVLVQSVVSSRPLQDC